MEYISYKTVTTFEEFNKLKEAPNTSIFYFSHDTCNVCKVLKPKIADLITENYPKINLYYINTVDNPDIAAQNSIFTVPVMILTFEGREYIRKARNISITELDQEIEKLYKMIYEG